MPTSIIFCVSILLCSAIWRIMLGFFVAQLNIPFIIMKYTILHYVLICIYAVFAYFISLYYTHNMTTYTYIFHIEYTKDSIYVAIYSLTCFILLHVLSVLDFYMQKVPNILLAILFICANILYYLTHNLYNFYSFCVLGVVYGVYFMLHLVGKRQYVGEGDVWVIASLCIILKSFFAYQASFIFEVLCTASFMGIFYYCLMLCRLKKINNLDSNNCVIEYSKTYTESISHKQDEEFKSKNNENIATKNKILSNTAKKTQNLDSSLNRYAQSIEIQNKKNLDSKNSLQIPFIPFLSLSFLCVSIYHVA